MTPEELKEIEERAEKATPGPWINSEIDPEDKEWKAFEIASSHPSRDFEYISTMTIGRDNADFIANAKTDIPALLAHIRELEEKNSILTDWAVYCTAYLGKKVPDSVLGIIEKGAGAIATKPISRKEIK